MNKKDVSKQVQALINKASVKQKALLVAMGRIDKENSGKDPSLTEEDVKAIKDSLREDQDRRKYNKWMGIYYTYAEIMPLFGLAYREYQATAERLLGALTLWESYTREEEHLMLICKALKEKGEDVTKELAKTLSSLKFSLAKLRVMEDGRPEIDASALYDEFILPYVEDVKSTYKTAKAMVIVTEEFTARTHSEEFRPGLMIKSIEKIKEDYAMRIAPAYSRKLLQEKKAKGIKVTPEEEKRAVYPSYEEIETDPLEVERIRKKLNSIADENCKR